MKIIAQNIVVRDGWSRYYTPEFLYLEKSSLSNGVYTDNRLADDPEANLILQNEIYRIDNTTMGTYSDKLIQNFDSIAFSSIHIPKMTKGGATAILNYPSLFIFENEWIFGGFGVLDTIIPSDKDYFLVSSGIIAPLMDGESHFAKLLKSGKVIVINQEKSKIFVHNTIRSVYG